MQGFFIDFGAVLIFLNPLLFICYNSFKKHLKMYSISTVQVTLPPEYICIVVEIIH